MLHNAAAQHCWLVATLAWAAVLHAAEGLDPSVYGSQPNPMGFHEGARRIVRCDGGHITGFYVYVSHLGGLSEPTANAIRVICSSSRIQLEFETGSFPDTMVFGNMPEASQPVKVECASGTGVAALAWRRVSGTEKDNTARVAGFKLYCGSESDPNPLIVDSKPSQLYPAVLKCSGTKAPPAGPKYKLTALEIWHEQLLSGLHLVSCAAA